MKISQEHLDVLVTAAENWANELPAIIEASHEVGDTDSAEAQRTQLEQIDDTLRIITAGK